jgi:hypothetical protein
MDIVVDAGVSVVAAKSQRSRKLNLRRRGYSAQPKFRDPRRTPDGERATTVGSGIAIV